jgi:hypothetical protein
MEDLRLMDFGDLGFNDGASICVFAILGIIPFLQDKEARFPS